MTIMTILFIGILIFLFLLGMPVAFGLGVTAFIMAILMEKSLFDINYGIIAQRIFYGPNNFLILAVPFFLLAGRLMNTSGITTRIYNFADALVGHVQGGLGQVNVLGSMIFAGMTGVGTSDAAGLGTVEIKAMRDAGYDDDFTVAITAASATIGPIIPPSVPLVIYGVLATVSVGRLLIGGIIPGILMGLALMVMVSFYAKKRRYPKRNRTNFKELLKTFRQAFLPLMTPVILVGGMISGVFTPTEAAAVAALYSFVLGVFVYREISLSNFWVIIKETAKDTAIIMFIVACALYYGWVLIRSRIPIILLEELTAITTDPLIILFILNGFFLIVGCFMETIAAMSILVPVLTPLIQKVGIDPLHFGLVMVLNLVIGLITPPFGMVLFVLDKVSGVPIYRIVKATLPFIIPLLVVLILITIYPPLVTFLPNLVMGK